MVQHTFLGGTKSSSLVVIISMILAWEAYLLLSLNNSMVFPIGSSNCFNCYDSEDRNDDTRSVWQKLRTPQWWWFVLLHCSISRASGSPTTNHFHILIKNSETQSDNSKMVTFFSARVLLLPSDLLFTPIFFKPAMITLHTWVYLDWWGEIIITSLHENLCVNPLMCYWLCWLF